MIKIYRTNHEIAVTDERCKLYITKDKFGRDIYLCKFHGPTDTIVKGYARNAEGEKDVYAWFAAMSSNFPKLEAV